LTGKIGEKLFMFFTVPLLELSDELKELDENE
jgi:hypothetical protein